LLPAVASAVFLSLALWCKLTALLAATALALVALYAPTTNTDNKNNADTTADTATAADTVAAIAAATETIADNPTTSKTNSPNTHLLIHHFRPSAHLFLRFEISSIFIIPSIR
jgi:hypothetical protein